MAAWTIDIKRFMTDRETPQEQIAVGVELNFYFTQEEVEASVALQPLADDANIDRLLLPENYNEWRDTIMLIASTVLNGQVEAAEVNGERHELTGEWVDDVDEEYESLTRVSGHPGEPLPGIRDIHFPPLEETLYGKSDPATES